eukprot:COSAG04_NODE_16250_length_505_cov_0.995074_1_plen_54_part_10
MLIGRRVIEVRAISVAEAESQDWEPARCKRTVALKFDDGTVLFAASSSDCEGPG